MGIVIYIWYFLHFIVGLLLGLFPIYAYLLIRFKRNAEDGQVEKDKLPCKTLAVLGSGGHTREMLASLSTLSPSLFTPRTYLYAETDNFSKKKAMEMERKRNRSDFECVPSYRCREVGQSWISSIFTTLLAIPHSAEVLIKTNPQLIICNGPGFCVPISVVAFIITLLRITNIKIVYIESLCRVETLSLSGKIMIYFADNFFVQWPNLHAMNSGSHFLGRIS